MDNNKPTFATLINSWGPGIVLIGIIWAIISFSLGQTTSRIERIEDDIKEIQSDIQVIKINTSLIKTARVEDTKIDSMASVGDSMAFEDFYTRLNDLKGQVDSLAKRIDNVTVIVTRVDEQMKK